MNDKVKRIGRQLGLDMEDTMPDGTVNMQYISSKKFTESLVQECVDVLLKCKSDSVPFSEETAIKSIKEHFGIRS